MSYGKIRANFIEHGSAGSATTEGIVKGTKSWVQFNGNSTITVNGSLNVASLTDHTTGDYSVNFTTNMDDTNYCVNTDSVSESNETDPRDTSVNLTRTFSTSTYGIICKYNAGSANDRSKMFGEVNR